MRLLFVAAVLAGAAVLAAGHSGEGPGTLRFASGRKLLQGEATENPPGKAM
jgi:hypothetical protein